MAGCGPWHEQPLRQRHRRKQENAEEAEPDQGRPGQRAVELRVGGEQQVAEPLTEPTNSPMTAPITASVTATLAPEKTNGSAAGNCTLANT